MEQAVTFINEVGFPIAAALGLGFFIWKLINRIIDGMETKLDVLINAASVIFSRYLLNTSANKHDLIMDVNLRAPFVLIN